VPVDHMPIHPCASCQSLIGSSLLFSMEYEDSASNLSVLSSCCSSQQCAAFRVRNGSFERGAMKIPQCACYLRISCHSLYVTFLLALAFRSSPRSLCRSKRSAHYCSCVTAARSILSHKDPQYMKLLRVN